MAFEAERFYELGDSQEHMAQRSQETWGEVFFSTEAQGFFSSKSFQFPLYDVPSYTKTPLKGMKDNNNLYANGSTKWRLNSTSEDCDFKDATSIEQLLIGVSKPTIGTMDGSFLWLGVECSDASDHSTISTSAGSSSPYNTHITLPRSQDNHLAAFTCAWAYIISAVWAESHAGEINYTTHCMRVPNSDDLQSSASLTMIDGCDEREAEWWSAVLTTGSGWKSTIKRDGEEYLSPWAIEIEDGVFAISGYTASNGRYYGKPATAREALDFLSRYCTTYGLHLQGRAALSAALTLPTHSVWRRPAKLPRPLHLAEQQQWGSGTSDLEFDDLLVQLPYLMTISSYGILSILRSALYDPQVYCHRAGAWLNPVLVNWPTSNEKIAILGSIRSPEAGGWWMGAAITSLPSKTFMPTIVGSGMWKTDLTMSWWTKTHHSFSCLLLTEKIHPQIATESGESLIDRVDEALLLLLTSARGPEGNLTRPSMSPWRPPGRSIFSRSSLDVQKHAECGHFLQYRKWIWAGLNSEIIDLGHTFKNLGCTRHQPIKTVANVHVHVNSLNDCNRDLWVHPTRSIFSWLSEMRGPEADESDVNTAELLQVFDDESETRSDFGSI
jgi:hypothetical protein